MARRLTEQAILFFSVLKWVVLATVVGAMVGLSTTLFLKVLSWATTLTNQYPHYYLLLPVAFFLSALTIRYLAPDAEGHGTEKVIEAVHKRSGRIRAIVVPVKLVATVITIAAGGSAGKEGPAAQIGAGLSSLFGDLVRFDDTDRKKLVICGISAGFAAVFGTPIAGAIFGVEALFIGSLLYDVLLPSFVAGIISYQVASAFGIKYFYHPISFAPVFNESFFIETILAGVFFGFCSVFIIESMRAAKGLSEKVRLWPPLKGIIGGSALLVLALIFSEEYLGLGTERLEASLQGERVVWYAFILKAIFTSVTLNFGGSGGTVTPIFFIGATSGALLAEVLGLNIATFSALGLVSVLAGATNTPIAASIMAVELFGSEIAPYAALACVISFLITGHNSIYPSQVLAMKKSASVEVEIGREVEKIATKFQPRTKTLIGTGLRISKTIRGKLRSYAKYE